MPSGRVVSYGYDGAGRVSSVTGTLNGSPTPYTTMSSTPQAPAYTAAGALQYMAKGNGVNEATTFNSRQQPVQIRAGGSSSLLQLNLYYCASQQTDCASNNGNLQEQDIQAPTTFSGAAVQTYSYNAVNRLCAAAEAATAVAIPNCTTALSGHSWQQNYVYDATGNRALLAGGYGTAGNGQAQVSSISSSVSAIFPNNRWSGAVADTGGSLTTLFTNGPQAVYDAENRVASMTEASMPAISYQYDGEGRRVLKTVGTATTEYVYDGAGELVTEYGATQPVSAGTYYPTADWLGSTRMVTGGTGNLVELRDYAPFGEELGPGVGPRPGSSSLYAGPVYPSVATDLNQVNFTGKERDAESGLDYFGFRYFSSAQGRWTSPDQPFADQHLEGPQSWNMYAYVRNNPLAHVDPNGKACSALNNRSGYCQRADLYGNLDMLVGSKTRFFAAASAASQEIADVAPPGSSAVTSAGTRNFLETTGEALEKANLESAGRILSGEMTGSPEVLDRAMVHKEQTEVQNQLNKLNQTDAAGYGTAIKEINTLLNGNSAASKSLILGGNVLFDPDKAYSKFLSGVRKGLGHDFDFSNQKDREAIGNALVQHIRDGGCDVTGDKVKCQ